MRREEATTNRAGTRLKRAGAIVLLISLLAVIVTVTLPRKRLLLSVARRVAPASFLWAGKVRTSYPCFWLSDQTAIAFQEPTAKRIVASNWTPGNKTFRVDAATGTYSPLPRFTKQFTAIFTAHVPGLKARIWLERGVGLHWDTPCCVSPDGNYALINEVVGPACFGQPDYASSRSVIIAIDGSYVFTGKWKRNEVTAFWEADSRHWKEWRWIGGRLESATYALDGTCRVERIPVPADLENYDLKPCAVTPAGTFLAEIEKTETEDVSQPTMSAPEKVAEKCSCELVELTMRSGTPLRRFAPCLPNVTKVTGQEIAVSPRCDRIAWLVTRRYEVTGPRLWRRIRARLGEKPHLETAIWISDLDGNHAHEVGAMPHQPDEASPRQLAWLPGGKQLSFSYRGDLYTVPAD